MQEFVTFFFQCMSLIWEYFLEAFRFGGVNGGGISYGQFLIAVIAVDFLVGALTVRFRPSSGDFKPGKPPKKSSGGSGSGTAKAKGD